MLPCTEEVSRTYRLGNFCLVACIFCRLLQQDVTSTDMTVRFIPLIVAFRSRTASITTQSGNIQIAVHAVIICLIVVILPRFYIVKRIGSLLKMLRCFEDDSFRTL